MTTTDVEVVRAEQAAAEMLAMERAAQAPGQLDIMPSAMAMAEWEALAGQARVLHLSPASPKQVRENPYLALHLAMIGRDFGISPSAALELVDVIDGRDGPQLSLSPQLLNAQIRKHRLGSIRPGIIELDEAGGRATAIARDATGVILGESEFTWEDARDAGLVGPDCYPRRHVQSVTKRRRDGSTYTVCGCNQGYITYPKRMLWWRAGGFAADDYFPEAGLGLYSPEALGAMVDEDGRPIDPAEAPLPAGYVDPNEEARRQQAERDAPADGETLWHLQLRARALPPGVQAQMRDEWPTVVGHKISALPARLVKTASAKLDQYERAAATAGVDMAAEQAHVWEQIVDALGQLGLWRWGWSTVEPDDDTGEAPEAPVSAPEDAPAPTAPETPTEPASEPGKPDWMPFMHSVAQATAKVVDVLNATDRAGLVAYMKKLHHARVNEILFGVVPIDDGGDVREWPAEVPHSWAEAPIDIRRMAATAHLAALRLAGTPHPLDEQPL